MNYSIPYTAHFMPTKKSARDKVTRTWRKRRKESFFAKFKKDEEEEVSDVKV